MKRMSTLVSDAKVDPGRAVAFHRAASSFFLVCLAAYYLSYPLKVLTAESELDVFRPMVVVAFVFFVARLVVTPHAIADIRVKRRELSAMFLLGVIVFAYLLNGVLADNDSVFQQSLYKHAAFTMLLVVLMTFHGRVGFVVPNQRIAWLVTFLSLATLTAVVLNSLFVRIPSDVLLLDKYYVGHLVRAGGGYLDPNFLSLNIASLIFVALMMVSRGSPLRWVNLTMLLVALFLTFSRGAYVFISLSVLMLFLRGSKSERRLVAGITVIAIALFFWLTELYGASFLFRRFADEEGISSTDDRLRQYAQALDYIASNFEVQNLFRGFGGMGVFYAQHAVHVHNYLLAGVLEVGLIPILLLMALFTYFFRTAGTLQAKLYLVFAGLQLMILPNLPDPLYLGFAISLVRVVEGTGAGSGVRAADALRPPREHGALSAFG
jgi:hypothetical protein